MKDRPQAACVGFEGSQGIGPRVALMDDNVEGESDGEIELFLKKNCLAIFKVRVLKHKRLGARGSASRGDGSPCKSAVF